MKMKVKMGFQGNLGYAPDQVRGMNLGELLEAVQEAVEEWGEDAEVVLEQFNNGYGANFGKLVPAAELFEAEGAGMCENCGEAEAFEEQGGMQVCKDCADDYRKYEAAK